MVARAPALAARAFLYQRSLIIVLAATRQPEIVRAKKARTQWQLLQSMQVCRAGHYDNCEQHSNVFSCDSYEVSVAYAPISIFAEVFSICARPQLPIAETLSFSQPSPVAPGSVCAT
jgi:hypothetical protein